MIKHCHHNINYWMNYKNDIHLSYRGQIIEMSEGGDKNNHKIYFSVIRQKNTNKVWHFNKCNRDDFYQTNYIETYTEKESFNTYDEAVIAACNWIDKKINKN